MTKSMWFCYGRADRCSVQVQSGRGNQLHELQEQIALLVIMSVHAFALFPLLLFQLCPPFSVFPSLCKSSRLFAHRGRIVTCSLRASKKR